MLTVMGTVEKEFHSSLISPHVLPSKFASCNQALSGIALNGDVIGLDLEKVAGMILANPEKQISLDDLGLSRPYLCWCTVFSDPRLFAVLFYLLCTTIDILYTK